MLAFISVLSCVIATVFSAGGSGYDHGGSGYDDDHHGGSGYGSGYDNDHGGSGYDRSGGYDYDDSSDDYYNDRPYYYKCYESKDDYLKPNRISKIYDCYPRNRYCIPLNDPYFDPYGKDIGTCPDDYYEPDYYLCWLNAGTYREKSAVYDCDHPDRTCEPIDEYDIGYRRINKCPKYYYKCYYTETRYGSSSNYDYYDSIVPGRRCISMGADFDYTKHNIISYTGSRRGSGYNRGGRYNRGGGGYYRGGRYNRGSGYNTGSGYNRGGHSGYDNDGS